MEKAASDRVWRSVGVGAEVVSRQSRDPETMLKRTMTMRKRKMTKKRKPNRADSVVDVCRSPWQ
jgi:hypothetical protein